MTQIIAVLESHAKTSRRASTDLSAQIIAALEKRPGDIVKCRRVFGDCYRCNWWAPDYTGDSLAVGYKIRHSRLLRATKSRGRLHIVDETR